jgi:hypothetical protein
MQTGRSGSRLDLLAAIQSKARILKFTSAGSWMLHLLRFSY